MRDARTIVARFLVALALIVQIVAPVRASVSMVGALVDPLAGVTLCGHDLPSSDRPGDIDACRLCDLVCHGAGFAAAPPAPEVVIPTEIVVAIAAPDLADDVGGERAVRPSFPRGPPKNV